MKTEHHESTTQKHMKTSQSHARYTLLLFISLFVFEQTTSYKTTSITVTGYLKN